MPVKSLRGASRRAMLALAVCGLAIAALAGIALAKASAPPLLGVASNAPVTNTSGVTKHESIVVDRHAVAVYWLAGETTQHPLCTKAAHCFGAWPPVTKPGNLKLDAASAIKGKLRVWQRNGFSQVTLGGHPLYTFAGDVPKKRSATGEGITSFGGVWHAALPNLGSSTAHHSPTPPPPPPTTPTYPSGY